MTKRAPIILAAAFVACGAPAPIVPPLDPGAQSLLLAFVGEAGEVRYESFDLLRGDAVQLELDGITRIEGASFRETSAELRLPEGRIVPTSSGDALPEPLARFEGAADRFEWGASAGPRLSGLLRPFRAACPRLVVKERWTTPISDGLAGIVPRRGAPPLVLVKRTVADLVTTVLEPIPGGSTFGVRTTVSGVLRDSHRVGDEIWVTGYLVNGGAAVWRADANGDLRVPPASTPPGLPPSFCRVQDSGIVDEALLLTTEGALYRHHAPSTFEELLPAAHLGSNPLGGLAIIGRDVLLVRPLGRFIERYSNGRVESEPTEIDAQLALETDQLLGVGVTPEGQAVVGTVSGLLLWADRGMWRAEERPEFLGRGIYTFANTRPGELLLLGAEGLLQQISVETKSRCAEGVDLGAGAASFFFDVDGDSVWIAGLEADRRVFLVRLQP